MTADPLSAPAKSAAADPRGQDLTAARRRAAHMAYALGIALFLRPDGTINQFAPGERILPAPGATPIPHGHGRLPEAAAAP